MSLVQQVDVLRVPCSGPGDLRGVQALIDEGALVAADIVAVMGKTEGNGCVNDHTRDFAATSWCHFLSPHLQCGPATVAERVALVMSGGTEGVLSPHFTVFARRWVEAAGHRDKRLVVGIAHTRDFLPEEIGRAAQIEATAAATLAWLLALYAWWRWSLQPATLACDLLERAALGDFKLRAPGWPSGLRGRFAAAFDALMLRLGSR